jgi:hypothetical protein
VVTGLVTINDNVPPAECKRGYILGGLGSFDMGPCKGRGFRMLSVLWVKPDVSFVRGFLAGTSVFIVFDE